MNKLTFRIQIYNNEYGSFLTLYFNNLSMYYLNQYIDIQIFVEVSSYNFHFNKQACKRLNKRFGIQYFQRWGLRHIKHEFN